MTLEKGETIYDKMSTSLMDYLITNYHQSRGYYLTLMAGRLDQQLFATSAYFVPEPQVNHF